MCYSMFWKTFLYLSWLSLFFILESWSWLFLILDSWILETWNFSWIFLLILELFLTQSWNHSHELFVIIFIIIKTPWINLDSSSWSNEACFYIMLSIFWCIVKLTHKMSIMFVSDLDPQPTCKYFVLNQWFIRCILYTYFHFACSSLNVNLF